MGFQAQTQKTETGKKVYNPLPNGNYTVTMDRVSEVPTKKGDGSLVKASFKVADGDYKGRLVFTNFLINHPSAQAAEIGRNQLSKCLKAMGVSQGFDGIGNHTGQLGAFLGREISVTIGLEEGNNGYPDRNKITKWMAR